MAETKRSGVEVVEIGGNCPVQSEGYIDGVPYYFRARGNHWSIEVGPGNTGLAVAAMETARSNGESVDAALAEADRLAVWYYDEPYQPDRPFAAGWMTEDEALAFIAKGASLYRARQGAAGAGRG